MDRQGRFEVIYSKGLGVFLEDSPVHLTVKIRVLVRHDTGGIIRMIEQQKKYLRAV